MRHKRDCAACAEFARSIRQVDKTLGEAVRVDVPEGLAARIMLRQSLQQSQGSSRHTSRRYALAASMLLTLSLAGVLYTIVTIAPFHRTVMAHLDGEWDSLVRRQDFSDEKLMSVLDAVGAELKGEIGIIRHASLCDFSEYGGAHLVLEGREGPVIVLLLPEQHIAGPKVVSGDKAHGVVVATNNGSMAIVADKDEALRGIERRVRASLVWRL